ncbi:MAG: hypothetical protein ACQEQ0_00815 [Bacteroidota bacterium]
MSGRLQRFQAGKKFHQANCLPLPAITKEKKADYKKVKGENFKLRGGFKGFRPRTWMSGCVHKLQAVNMGARAV